MKKRKLEIGYKIGFSLYLITIFGILGFLGCQTSKCYKQKQIEKEVEEMLDFGKVANYMNQ